MTRFLIQTARQLLVGSWIALIVGAYLAISGANGLANDASISDGSRFALIGMTVIVAVIYTAICGVSLVMFGVHDRLSEISDSLALVADKFCNDVRPRGTRPELAADIAEHRPMDDSEPNEPATERRYVAAPAVEQPVSPEQSWWSGASSAEKAVIILILAVPIVILWVSK